MPYNFGYPFNPERSILLPGVPTDLTVIYESDTTVRITWSAPIGGDVEPLFYDIQYYSGIYTTRDPDTFATLTAPANVAVDYRVRSVGAEGNRSAWTDIVTYTNEVLPPIVSPADYYVATYGLAGNTGASDSPFDIATGLATVGAGQSLCLFGGTYLNNGLALANNGTSGNLITIFGNEGDTVIIDGEYDSGENTVLRIAKDYVLVKDITITRGWIGLGIGGSSIDVTAENIITTHTQSSGIICTNSTNITVNNCDISDHTEHGQDEGLTFFNVAGVTCINNKVHHGGKTNGHFNGIGIDIKDGCTDVIAYGNKTYNNPTQGFYMDSRGITDGVEIYDNESYDNGGIGFSFSTETIDSSSILRNFKIYNNISYGNLATGMNLGYNGRDCQFENFDIVNNVIYDNGNYGIKFTCQTGSTGIRMNNNILTQNGTASGETGAGDVYIEDGIGVEIDTNMVTSQGIATGENYIEDDPEFTDASNGDFTLQITSPAINAGLASAFIPTTDYYGNPRPVDTVDIGAYEEQTPVASDPENVWINFSELSALTIVSSGEYINEANYNIGGGGFPPFTEPLVKIDGTDSVITFDTVTEVTAPNSAGMSTGNNSGVVPDSMLSTSWYNDVGVVSECTVGGLNDGKTYTIILGGSRDSTATDRVALYTVNGASQTLDAAQNTTQEVSFLSVVPISGEISITLTTDTDSSFAYMNWLKIEEETVLENPELIVNGDFANGDTGWVINSPWWELDGEAVRGTDATSSTNFYQHSVPISAGEIYTVEIELLESTSGEATIEFNNAEQSPAFSGVGVHSFDLDSTGANGSVTIRGVTTFSGLVDNVSVKLKA